MRRTFLKNFVLVAVFFLFAPAYVYAHKNSLPIETLPFVEIEIKNQSDVFVSLTINSLCATRIILRPGEAIIIKNCLRHGLTYQGSVIFYTNQKVLECHPFAGTARPNDPWIFCKLPKNETRCR